MTPQSVLRRKRDGHNLTAAEITHFAAGLVNGSWSDAQVGAMGMAIYLRGMQRDECAGLTQAMAASGTVLRWDDLPGPSLDKHSSGGVGDKTSLLLAPWVAACGGYVPMVSGRGLGHTGGTCDKLDAIPGYTSTPTTEKFRHVVRDVGCAIVAQTDDFAPADRRLYSLRDATETVESIPLITVSILSKKMAAGPQHLVMDVKYGNGAFLATQAEARSLARNIVDVACAAGLQTTALLTDMNQVLGRNVGNSLEVREALDYLTGTERDPRLHQVTLALATEMLVLAGISPNAASAEKLLMAALDSGAAVECFGRMVAALGGPANLLDKPDHHFPPAPVIVPVLAPHSGVFLSTQTRGIGLLVRSMTGSKTSTHKTVDSRLGLSAMCALGSKVTRGQTLAFVHAKDQAQADRVATQLLAECTIGEPDTDFCSNDSLISRLD